jgi:hypothetical protein
MRGRRRVSSIQFAPSRIAESNVCMGPYVCIAGAQLHKYTTHSFNTPLQPHSIQFTHLLPSPTTYPTLPPPLRRFQPSSHGGAPCFLRLPRWKGGIRNGGGGGPRGLARKAEWRKKWKREDWGQGRNLNRERERKRGF